jgi:hypothetical protein
MPHFPRALNKRMFVQMCRAESDVRMDLTGERGNKTEVQINTLAVRRYKSSDTGARRPLPKGR